MPRTRMNDDPKPTRRGSDWTGAELVRPGEPHSSRPVAGGMTFQVFRASNEPDEFLVTDQEGASRLPRRRAGTWLPFRALPETGRPRVGFSEEEAKRDIASKGFHVVKVSVRMREHAHG